VDADNAQKYLDDNVKKYKETGVCDRLNGTYMGFVCNFLYQGKQIGVEINVAGGSPPYVDAVIFSIDGDSHENDWHEISTIEKVGDDLLGEYHFEVNGDKYIVNVEECLTVNTERT